MQTDIGEQQFLRLAWLRLCTFQKKSKSVGLFRCIEFKCWVINQGEVANMVHGLETIKRLNQQGVEQPANKQLAPYLVCAPVMIPKETVDAIKVRAEELGILPADLAGLLLTCAVGMWKIADGIPGRSEQIKETINADR